MPAVIHWFRRDLRLTDNPALNAAHATGAIIIPVYIQSEWRTTHRWTGPKRQEFLCGCLESLDGNLRTIGGRLIIRRGAAVEELGKLVKESAAEAIFYNRDPDPFGRKVEAALRKAAEEWGIRLVECQDVCLHERDEVLTGGGDPYKVFTPYSRNWLKLEKTLPGPRLKTIAVPEKVKSLPLPTLADWNLKPEGEILAAGEKAARLRLTHFLEQDASKYAANRDFPAIGNTSRISQDLRFGLLSIRGVYERAKSHSKFVSELIWREFYQQLLWHFPELLEQEFNAKYRGMDWPGTRPNFDQWCAGQTGFPIVDAGIRELLHTGFMHNRVRMIVAMFLTKDLHLDWRMGESFFMQQLVDGEIASNNGGWQWSAGTGADAAPYFRIQNPWTQTKRFDPEGEYVKRWVPELRDVPAARFFLQPEEGTRLAKNYPEPMVNHAYERDRTLELFRRA